MAATTVQTAPNVEPGSPHPLGATPGPEGVNFSLFSGNATGVELLLFDRHDAPAPSQVIQFDPFVNKSFHFWHVFVRGLGAGAHYAFRVEGPFNPAAGQRFDQGKVLVDLYARGFNSDSGSYTESIPIAAYSRIKVVAVLYRLAPEHPFPAAVDDSVAVYKELLKTCKPGQIVIYGTSAGAILTAEVATRLKQLGLPLPAALGIFSGVGDFSRDGDSQALYGLRGLSGHLDPPGPGPHDSEYVVATDPRDPVLSPIFSDPRGLPPTLFVTSGRDLLLSGTVNLHRAYFNAGVDARLVVFDALPHAFWYDSTLPEAIEANHMMADFFIQQLRK